MRAPWTVPVVMSRDTFIKCVKCIIKSSSLIATYQQGGNVLILFIKSNSFNKIEDI